MGLHDSLRDNGSFNKILNEDTVTLCSFSKTKKEPYKIFLSVGKFLQSIFILYFFYFQLEDVSKLVQYLGFILNFRRGVYRENAVSSGNFKVIYYVFFIPFYLLVTLPNCHLTTLFHLRLPLLPKMKPTIKRTDCSMTFAK